MARRFGVTVDCADPVRLAAFWREILHYQDDPPPEGYSTWAEFDRANNVPAEEAESGFCIVDPTGEGPRLFFVKVPEAKTVKNRWHLDVVVSTDHGWKGVLTEVERAVRLGATYVHESDDQDDQFVVLLDPEGNEFCLVR